MDRSLVELVVRLALSHLDLLVPLAVALVVSLVALPHIVAVVLEAPLPHLVVVRGALSLLLFPL